MGVVFVNQGGIIAPGHSPGCLNTGNLNINGTYNAQLGGTTACSGYDQLNVTGTVSLESAAALNVTHWNNYRPKVNDKFIIINNDLADPVTGTFAGLPEGASLTVDGVVYTISYIGGDGNDVTLTVKTAPAAPNTGFVILKNNPSATLLGTLLVVTGFGLLARRQLGKQ